MQDNRETNFNFGENIRKWLSFKGRINRQDFLLYYALPFILLNILPIPFSSLFSIWVLLAGTVKRLHDSHVTRKVFIPLGVLWAIVVVLSTAVSFFFSFGAMMGAMTGDISTNEFYDQLIVFSIPILAFLLLPLYAGLKPSSPDENEYGPPTVPSALNRRNKIIIVAGFIVFIVLAVVIRRPLNVKNQEAEPAIMYTKEVVQEAEPALIEAIKFGKNVSEIRTLLENGEDPNQRTGLGTTALMLTLDKRPYDRSVLMALLLEYGADPNINCALGKGLDEKSPLLAAIEVGNADIVKLLLDYGADPNSEVNDNVLQAVAERGSIDAIKLLLAGGISPDQISATKQWVENKLEKANSLNQPEIRKQLLEIQHQLTEAENNTGS